jgi:acyl dehydratase
MAEDFRARARLWPKGRLYEDFQVGEVRQHHWGRTIALSDTLLFTTLTLSYNPLYCNRVYAEARVSASNPSNGVVTWLTEGFNQAGERVIDFERSNLVRLRHPPARAEAGA